MNRRLITVIAALLFATVTASSVQAALNSNYVIPGVPTFWQNYYKWGDKTYDHGDTVRLGCGVKKDGTYSPTIARCGCALTSLVTLLNFWGLGYKPIPWPYCDIDVSKPTDPPNLNDWLLSTKNKGYDSLGNVQWYSMKNYYYCGVYPGSFYLYMRPYRSCAPSLNNDCFQVKWSTSTETLLDLDLLSGRPDIARITKSNGKSHFVVVAGYCASKSDYIIYDPAGVYYPLSGTCDPANLQFPTLQLLYPGSKISRIYRYQGVFTNIAPRVGYLYFYDLSPIQYQIINPQGQITGYDPATGNTIQDASGANYFEESIDSADPDDPPSEPSHVLMMDEPPSGNYIIKVFGMGDGPYTVKMTGMTDDGTALDDAPIITGTAYPGMVETYRISYSASTGQTTISTSNQVPVANAGADQTVKIGTAVTFDGSASYDSDGDPLKYSWSFTSKPVGSSATLSNADTKSPSFTPDLPGQYILKLVVNDFFTDSSPAALTITAFSNQPPVADAGPDQNIILSGSSTPEGAPPIWVSFDGSKSYDPDNDAISYKWSLLSKPALSNTSLSATNVVNPALMVDVPGAYTVQLIVNDGFIDSSPDTVTATALNPIDVAIKAFRAPSRMVLGDTKEVTVVVKNLSSVDASFEVIVDDISEGNVGRASGVEGVGKGGTAVKIPYTPTTAGAHILAVTVRVTNPLSDDPNKGDNIATDTVLVVAR